MKMELSHKHNKCKSIRQWLAEAMNSRLSIRAGWVQAHIAQCPRCQKRMSGFNRVSLAICLIKSQTHSKDLLKRANQKAIGVLQRSVRTLPQANKLRQVQPEQKFRARLARFSQSLSSAAACLAILLLMRTGVFCSMEKFQTKGQQTMQQYYAHHLGEDMADDIYTT